MMNHKELPGSWNERKARLKQKFAAITNNDQMLEDGRKDEIFAKLQLKLGKTKEELNEIIDGLCEETDVTQVTRFNGFK